MSKLALAFISGSLLVSTSALAAGADQGKWVVTQLSGDARVVHPGLQPASLKVNAELAPGDELLTGLTGRATLVRGGDYIIVAPHSELRLPSAPQPSGFTRVVQNLGTLLFKVQHTGIPHFAVDTPMLAAVVKGTTFTVVVDEHRSAVQVIQGRVQVSAIDGGMSRMVDGGRSVFINHDRPNMVLDADKPLPATSAPSSTSVKVSAAGDSPFANVASLTGGLVRAEIVPAPSLAAAAVPAVVPLVSTNLTTSSPTTAPGTTPTSASPGTTATTPVPPASSAPAVTVATNVPVISSTATVSVQPATAPVATATSVLVPVISTPTITIGSNSGPGSLSSGSGSSNSGPGSLTSGSGGSNSGPGSLNSGPGSISSGGNVIVAVSTPSVTVPSVTIPIVPIATPTVTVPSVDVAVQTAPAPAPVLSIPIITVGPLKL